MQRSAVQAKQQWAFFRKTLSRVHPTPPPLLHTLFSWAGAASSVKIHFQSVEAVGCSPVCIPVQVTDGNWVDWEHPAQNLSPEWPRWSEARHQDPFWIRRGKEMLMYHRDREFYIIIQGHVASMLPRITTKKESPIPASQMWWFFVFDDIKMNIFGFWVFFSDKTTIVWHFYY